VLPARSLLSPRMHWRNPRRVRRRASGRTVAYNLRFPGQVFDGQAGLHQNGFRDYDPAIGRYPKSDPMGLWAGVNTYAYVRGNPISRRDPLGLADEIPTPPDPSKSIDDDTGAGTKAYNACEAADRQATALFKAAEARAKSDWKAFNEHMQEADRELNKYMENTNGKAQDAPTAPRGPEPETPLPSGTIKPVAPPDVSLPKINF
jgi:RHS repeat-associated protein